MDATGSRGWVSYDSEQESISQFLHEWKPSCTSSEDVEWIYVRGKYAGSRIRDDEDTEGLKQSWDSLCTEKGGQVCIEDVKRLAVKYNVLGGKWMIFAPTNKIDKVWGKVATAVAKGQLGLGANVSTLKSVRPNVPKDSVGEKQEEEAGDVAGAKLVFSCTHVICVYSENFLDSEDVFKLRMGLTQIGFHSKLQYKPDAFTVCGIYSQNIWNLPTIAYRK